MPLKKISLFIIVCLSFSLPCAFSAFADTPKEVNGLDWLEMPIGSRLEAVLPAMAILQKNGVPMDETPNDCYDLIRDLLSRRPSYYGATLTQVLAQALYEKDEKVRASLDRLRKNPTVKKIEMH